MCFAFLVFFPLKFCPKPSGSSPCFSLGREAIAEEQEQRREFYLAFDLLDRFLFLLFLLTLFQTCRKATEILQRILLCPSFSFPR